MAERPPPESIRGSWFYLPTASDLGAAERTVFLYRFRLDGTFSLYSIRDDHWLEKEKGDYTFDGQFLIVRGRNTDTYRVRPDAFWRWLLEGKKEEYMLTRALVPAKHEVILTPEQQKEIRILPIRVSVAQNNPGGLDGIYHLIFNNGDDKLRLASLFVEHSEDDGRMWIGLSKFCEGIEPKTWERIVRESFLDIHLGKPKGVNVVTVRVLNDNQSNVFSYAMG